MQRRKFIQQGTLGVVAAMPMVQAMTDNMMKDIPYFTTGIKMGEISSNEAVVWARLTKAAVRVADKKVLPKSMYLDDSNNEWHTVDYFSKKYKQDRPNRPAKSVLPEGKTIDMLDGAVPGIRGEMRVLYKKKGSKKWMETSWKKVDDSTDFAGQFNLSDLTSNKEYEIEVEARINKNVSNFIEGKFSTAPTKSEMRKVKFMVTTCHEYTHQDDPTGGGFKIFKEMQALNPDFLVHTGDVLYHDHISKNLSLARWNWQKMNSLTNAVAFYKDVPCYFMKDDHDTWMNDSYPASTNKFMGDFTFQQGVELFRQQVPSSDKPYRTFRWGKDVQIWMVDVRENRVPNELPDGPAKTIWGPDQMAWFKETYAQSDATFKVLISPTPIIGPDRPQKKDNHSNSNYKFEGDAIRNLIAPDKNTFVICGDRHWQYISKHAKTGTYEFACGPGSDEHAGGWKKEDVLPEHEYLNIIGGFLQVEVERKDDKVQIVFNHISVDGKRLSEKRFEG
jgi:alkaline phosphatase D